MRYNLEISYATRNKDGRKNQDNLMIDRFISSCSGVSYCSGYLKTDTSEKRLVAVSDGAGGCAKGEAASEICVETLCEHLSEIKKDETKNSLRRALDDTNNKVVSFFENLGELGVATLSGLLFEGGKVLVFNAGDSPVYLISDGVIELISQEHTLAGKSVKGKKSEEENIITRYMGDKNTPGSETVYSGSVLLTQGMIFVIASDGIDKGLGEKDIKKLSEKNEEFTAGILVEKAYRNGAGDDITAIVIKVSEGTGESECE